MSRGLARALVALPMLLIGHESAGASWSLGSHFGVSSIRSERPGSGTSTVLAWPFNAFVYQPGLRLGLGNASRAHELVVDSGLFVLDQAGSTLSLFTASAGYQHTFRAPARNAAFVNAGVGVYREGGEARTSSSATFGGGLGVRHVVGDRRGTLRAELRADRLQPDDVLGRPALNIVGLRLGFDLWL